jgi:uncharacterized membrane protein YccF (DUF307 family)
MSFRCRNTASLPWPAPAAKAAISGGCWPRLARYTFPETLAVGKSHGHIHLTGPTRAAGAEKLMSGLALVLNLLWIVFGGLWMAVGWAIAALIMAVTIVGLPWTWSALTLASYTLLPFGHRVVSRSTVTGQEDLGTGPLGVIGNLIWLLLAGWWLALGHLVTAALLAITIIGIPFAWAHLKLARLALWPIGKMVVLA